MDPFSLPGIRPVYTTTEDPYPPIYIFKTLQVII